MNAPYIELRAALAADLAPVLALLAHCGLPGADLDAAHLADFVVAWRAGALVGCAGLQRVGEAALLRSVAVAPACRGAGLGQRLVQAGEARAGAAGVVGLYLIAQDDAAERYFGLRGYAVVARAQVPEGLKALAEFTHLCPASHPCLMRTLARGAGRAG